MPSGSHARAISEPTQTVCFAPFLLHPRTRRSKCLAAPGDCHRPTVDTAEVPTLCFLTPWNCRPAVWLVPCSWGRPSEVSEGRGLVRGNELDPMLIGRTGRPQRCTPQCQDSIRLGSLVPIASAKSSWHQPVEPKPENQQVPLGISCCWQAGWCGNWSS